MHLGKQVKRIRPRVSGLERLQVGALCGRFKDRDTLHVMRHRKHVTRCVEGRRICSSHGVPWAWAVRRPERLMSVMSDGLSLLVAGTGLSAFLMPVAVMLQTRRTSEHPRKLPVETAHPQSCTWPPVHAAPGEDAMPTAASERRFRPWGIGGVRRKAAASPTSCSAGLMCRVVISSPVTFTAHTRQGVGGAWPRPRGSQLSPWPGSHLVQASSGPEAPHGVYFPTQRVMDTSPQRVGEAP